MTTTTTTTACASWCTHHTDYAPDPDCRCEHGSEPLSWSRKSGFIVELLQLDDEPIGLHIRAGDSEMDAEKVTPDDLLNLMRRLAEILAAWQSEASR